MSRHFLFKLGIPLILLVVVATGTYAYVLNGAKSNALHTLGALGFTNPNIGETKYQKGHAFHLNTQIDDQNLSTLELISNPLPLVANIMGSNTNDYLIAGLQVTGRLDRKSGLDVTSWMPSKVSASKLPPMIMKKTNIDLMTPIGGLSFDLNAQISAPNQDGLKDVVINLNTKQYELKFNTVWEGTISKSGDWQYDITVNDAGFNLDKAQASRLSGWFTLQKAGTILPETSGQLNFGMLTITPIILHNVDMTFEGTYGDMQTIIKANVAGFENMTLAIDTKQTESGRTISASIETNDKDDLLKVMAQLRDVKLWQSDQANLSSLMLTEGNLKSLYSSLKDKNADTYTLQVNGTALSLAGKIIGNKDNSQSFVISLDPAQRNL